MSLRSSFSFVFASSLIALVLVAVTPASAGMIELQSNQVPDGSINTTGGNNDRSDWSSVPSYNADGNDGATSDWQAVSIAHDSANFYVRYQMNATTFIGFLDTNQRMFIDADRDRNTGFTGGGDQFSIGADYMIEGSTLYTFNGLAQTTFDWTGATGLNYDDFPTFDHELTLPRAAIGSPQVFHFLLFASGSPEDYYPNSASGGDGYFAYGVPEPASLATLVLMSAAVLTRRGRR